MKKRDYCLHSCCRYVVTGAKSLCLPPMANSCENSWHLLALLNIISNTLNKWKTTEICCQSFYVVFCLMIMLCFKWDRLNKSWKVIHILVCERAGMKVNWKYPLIFLKRTLFFPLSPLWPVFHFLVTYNIKLKKSYTHKYFIISTLHLLASVAHIEVLKHFLSCVTMKLLLFLWCFYYF